MEAEVELDPMIKNILLNPPNTDWEPSTESWDWLDADRRISLVISASESNSSYKSLFLASDR